MDESIACVKKWAVANKMASNQQKTKAMLITGKRLPAKIGSTQLDLQREQVSSAKLLCLDIDDELSFKDCVHTICKKLAKRIGTLKHIAYKVACPCVKDVSTIVPLESLS